MNTSDFFTQIVVGEIEPAPFKMPEVRQRLVITSPFAWSDAIAVFEPITEDYINVRFVENGRLTHTKKPIRTSYAWDLLTTMSYTDWRGFEHNFFPWNPNVEAGLFEDLQGGVK